MRITINNLTKKFFSLRGTTVALDEINLNHNSHMSTSLTFGGEISINADTTKIDIAAGKGIVTDSYTDDENPTFTQVPWTVKTAITITNIATQPITYFSSGESCCIVPFRTLRHRSAWIRP